MIPETIDRCEWSMLDSNVTFCEFQRLHAENAALREWLGASAGFYSDLPSRYWEVANCRTPEPWLSIWLSSRAQERGE